MAEEIARPKIVVETDTRQAIDGLNDVANASEKVGDAVGSKFAGKMTAAERAAANFEKRVNRLAAELSGSTATRRLEDLAAAVDKLGGVQKLTSAQTENLAKRIELLKAAGGAVPASLQGVTRSVKTLDDALKGEGLNRVQALGDRAGALGSVLQNVGPAGLAAAAGVGAVTVAGGALVLGLNSVLRGLTSVVSKTVEAGDDIKTMSEKTQLGVIAVQDFSRATEHADVPIEKVAAGVQRLQNEIVKGNKAIAALGLDANKLRELLPEDALRQVAERIADITNKQEQLAASASIFGQKAGGELLPLLRALDKAGEAGDRFGRMSETQVEAAAHMDEALTSLNQAWQGLVVQFGSAALEGGGLTETVQTVTDTVTRLIGFVRENKDEIGAAFEIGARWAKYFVVGLEDVTAKLAPLVRLGLKTLPGGAALLAELERETVLMAARRPVDLSNLKNPATKEPGPAQWAKLLERRSNAGTRFDPNAGEDEAKTAEAAARLAAAASQKERALIESLSGRRAQQEMDTLTRYFERHRAEIEKDVEQYVRFVEKARQLEQQGARLPKVFQDIERAALESAKAMGPESGPDIARRFGVAFGPDNPLSLPMPGLVTAPWNQRSALDLGVGMAELNRVLDPSLGLWTRYPDVLAAELAAAATATGEVEAKIQGAQAETRRWADVLAQTADMFRVLGVGSSSTLGSIVGGLSAASAAGERFKAALHGAQGSIDMLGTGVAALHGAVGVISQTSGKSNAAGVLSGASQGAAFGAQFGVQGAIVGGLAGAIVGGVTAGLTRSANAAEHLGREYGQKFSQGLTDKIDEDAKRIGDIGAAGLLNLRALIDDVGGIAFGADKAAGAARDLFSELQRGRLTLTEVGKSFDSVFGDIAATHIDKATGLASAQLLELVTLARDFKIESPALLDFIKTNATQLGSHLLGSVSAIRAAREAAASDAGTTAERVTRNRLRDQGGFSEEEIAEKARRAGDQAASAAASAVGIVSQNAATALGASVFATFEELVVGGMSRADALQQVKPAVEALRHELQAAGFEGGAAFAELERQISIVTDEITGPLLTSTGSLTGSLVTLYNAGRLNQEIFGGITEQIGANITKLREQGVEGPALIQALQPDLQKVWELQRSTGLAVDATTQALLDEAVASGKVGEEHRSAADKMLDASERTAKAVEFLAERFGYLRQEIERLPASKTIDVNVNERRTDRGPMPLEPTALPQHREGGLFRYRPGGVVGIFAEKENEYAVPESKAAAFAAYILERASYDVPSVSQPSMELPIRTASSSAAPRSVMPSSAPVQVTVHINGAHKDPKEIASEVAYVLDRNLAPGLVDAIRARVR